MSSNRTILELKPVLPVLVFSVSEPSNRTILELKLPRCSTNWTSPRSSNRTILELKPAARIGSAQIRPRF